MESPLKKATGYCQQDDGYLDDCNRDRRLLNFQTRLFMRRTDLSTRDIRHDFFEALNYDLIWF